MVSYPCGPPSSLDTGMSMASIGSRLVCPLSGCPVRSKKKTGDDRRIKGMATRIACYVESYPR